MNREHLDILMNRAIDGKASPPEREELARALMADPTLRAEYDELAGAHLSTVALFERLELPTDFTARVMRKVQPDHVPTDADLTAIIEDSDLGTQLAAELAPSPAPAMRRTALLRRQATITTILSSIGAFSAAAALFLAIGFLTGIIGSGKPQATPEVSGQPEKSPGRGNPAPAPKRDAGRSVEPGVPDAPKPEPKQPENPQPKEGEEEEDKLPPVKKDERVEGPDQDPPREESPAPKTGEPKNDGPKVEVPPTEEKKEPANPGTEPTPGSSVEPKKPVEPDSTDPQPKAPQTPAAWGRMLSVPSGRVNLPDESGKLVVLDSEVELRVGMKLTTSANCVSVFNWRAGGHFAAGRRTVFTLTSEGFNFEGGEVAVDFDGGKVQPVVAFDAYSLTVRSGVVLLVRKTSKKVAISQSSGQSVLRFGEHSLTIDAGAQVDVEFGKMPASPKTKPFVLPEWCGVVRREVSLARIEKQLSTRKFTSTETTGLQDQIVRLGRLPHASYLLVGLMNRVLELESFSAKDLIAILGDVEEAYQANQELSLDETLKMAFECACEIKSYAEWSKRFANRLREFAKRELVKDKKGEPRDAKELPNGQRDGSKKVEDSKDGDKALDKQSRELPKGEEHK
jgi:hypothetical protein